MFNVSNRRNFVVAMLLLMITILAATSVSAEGSAQNQPNETFSLNFANLVLTLPSSGTRSFSNVVVGPSNTPNGITFEFDMTTSGPNGRQTTNHIIAVLIALLVDNRMSYTLENVMISSYSDTVPSNVQNALRRVLVRSLTNAFREQMGSGHRITGFEVTGDGITVTYR
ncbi:MAG: hypothetical protein U0670_00655 [Anaerolineae bacterium]